MTIISLFKTAIIYSFSNSIFFRNRKIRKLFYINFLESSSSKYLEKHSTIVTYSPFLSILEKGLLHTAPSPKIVIFFIFLKFPMRTNIFKSQYSQCQPAVGLNLLLLIFLNYI
jgi:hypothetical protein